MLIISTNKKIDSLVARERAAGESVFVEANDNAAFKRLQDLSAAYDPVANHGKRLECYLILSDATPLWVLQTVGLSKEIEARVDVFATTVEDLLAKNVFVKLPNLNTGFPPLDRVMISSDSDMVVHLVVFGNSAQADALVMNAALVAHYPNYCRNTRLRTRITVIDENVYGIRDRLTQRYVYLFENSYYRTLDLNDANPQCVLNSPLYEHRKDFVDVEWEFVNGSVRNEAVRQKLTEWSTDCRRQLTIAVCHADCQRNTDEAFELPRAVYDNEIPTLCYTDDDALFRVISDANGYRSIYPFSNDCCNIDTLRMLKKLAQRVSYVYSYCFSLPSGVPAAAPSSIDEVQVEEAWQNVGSLPKQYSNIFHAMTLGTKMHSVGHASDDWDGYYALTMEEINILAEVEHNRWSVEELILGYRPVTDEEQTLVENDIAQKKILRSRKVHYDLRAFDDLRLDSSGKNVNVYDIVLTQGIPLIIKSCITD